MSQAKSLAPVLGILAATACGPSFSESRMGYHPPRPADCEVKVINLSVFEALKPDGDNEMIGMITAVDGGEDPFSPELMAELRPRVCKMGGELITLQQSQSFRDATTYTILKPRASAAAPPGAVPPPAAPAE